MSQPTPDPKEHLMATDPQQTAPDADADTELVAEDLVEEVSIDGMCGVY